MPLGDGVDDLAAGDRVVMTFLPRCGGCPECATDGLLPCRVGSAATGLGLLVGDHRRLSRDGEPVHHHLGVSEFASHAVVNRTSVVRVDADVPPEVAALLGCAVLTGGVAVVNAGRPREGDTVMVVGLGGGGMAALLVAGGTTVTVGLPAPDARASVSPLMLTAEARTVVGSYLGSAVPARDIPLHVDLRRSGRLPLERLVSSRIALHDLDVAMDRLAAGGELRQLIVLDERNAPR
ncbi:hypothetical protein ASG23_09680 [Cellulomonas sp. Leaf395]|nr:hypothetical protein ASG23_09680 [Cellulomonas sp. Leaf395]